MKKIVVIVFAGLLVSAGLQAQKVCIENNKVILDLTEAAGMPAGAMTYVSKINSTGSAADNNQVFEKLEIAPSDLGEMDWANAIANCKAVGPGWRLPTQRELMLICIFRDVLNDNALPAVSGAALDTSPSSAFYRCATETGATSAWFVNFANGTTHTNNNKATSYRVRCVREVTTP
jgi:hypothetical protein